MARDVFVRRAVARTAPVRVAAPARVRAVVPSRPLLAREGGNVFGSPMRPAAAGLMGAPIRPAGAITVAPVVPRLGEAMPGVVGGRRAAMLGETLPGLRGYGMARVPSFGLSQEELGILQRRRAMARRLPAVARQVRGGVRSSPYATIGAVPEPEQMYGGGGGGGGYVPAYEPIVPPTIDQYGSTAWKF